MFRYDDRPVLFTVKSTVTNIVYSVYGVKTVFGHEKYLIYNNHGFYSDFEWWDSDRFVEVELQNSTSSTLDKDRYVKVVYRSEPIGEEKIILELTTFDTEAFERDEKLKKIPEKRITKSISIDRCQTNISDYIYKLEEIVNAMVEQNYKFQIEELKAECEMWKNMTTNIIPVNYENNAKNISNSDDVHCNTVYGDIKNCDNIYCHEIKGNVVNCNKIIYK